MNKCGETDQGFSVRHAKFKIFTRTQVLLFISQVNLDISRKLSIRLLI